VTWWPSGLAPHADDLRHDARQIGVHHPRVQRARRPLGYEVDDADAQLTHTPVDYGYCTISWALGEFCGASNALLRPPKAIDRAVRRGRRINLTT